MELIAQVNSAINSFVWGPVMIVLIVGTGIYLTLRTGFFQVSRIPIWWKGTIMTLFGGKRKKEAAAGSVTPFQALTTALAATVGTGNIVGVATAIVGGGPGAIFWMWVSAFFGMMTKYSEIVLSIRFRKRNEAGEWVGGPMYYIREGLGSGFSWLGTLFAAFGALACFGIGNMTQVNSIVSSWEGTFVDLGLLGAAAGDGEFSMVRLVIGIILAVVCAMVVLGGMKRIGQVTELFVPFMCVLFILGGIVALILNADQIGAAFSSIFAGAFSMQAFGGGVLGYVMMSAIRYGIARGIFSNEAGLGSAPIAHAGADTDSPVKQGLWGIFEVFVDTILICSFTGLIILTSGIPGVLTIHETPEWNGALLTMNAFKATFGLIGSLFLTIAISLFAFSTVLSWCLYGTRCFEFLFKGKGVKVFQIVFVLCVVVASVMELSLVWDIADTLNGMMAIPNLIALLFLSPIVFKLTKEFLQNRNKEKE